MKYSFKIFTSVLILFFPLLVGIPSSQAIDQCFSNLPDSAWQSGEPLEVKNQLNYDLIGNQNSTYSEGQVFNAFDWFNSNEGALINLITYEYIGKNCSKRTIQLQKTIEVAKPSFISKEDIIAKVKSNSTNFVEENESMKKIEKSIALFQSKTVISGLGGQIRLNTFLIRQNLPETFFEEAYGIVSLRGVGGAIIGTVNSTGCNFDRSGKSFKAAFLHTTMLGITFNKVNSCNTKWYVLDKDNKVFPLGELIFMREQIIKCSKGKLTKSVTGTNPQCPKGYKRND